MTAQLTVHCLVYSIIIITWTTLPYVTGSALSLYVTEEQPPGTHVGNVKRVGDNNFRYSFIGSSHSGYFQIDGGSGDVTTSSVLDREQICDVTDNDCRKTYTIYANTDDVYTTFPVIIHIADINDNAPLFADDEYGLAIPESSKMGSAFRLPLPVDKDSQKFSKISIAVSPNNLPFSVEQSADTKELNLVVTRNLDREMSAEYNVIITVSDNGNRPLSSSLNVYVNVTDVNDNPPLFDKNIYNTSILENVPLTYHVITVLAKDHDSGDNSKIVYSIKSINVPFIIDKNSGEIVVNGKIDREVKAKYDIAVIAQDSGSRIMTSPCVVIVNIVDTNDNKPEITFNIPSNGIHASILENASYNSYIGHVSAYDADAGPSGMVMCVCKTPGFRLKWLYASEYEIILARALDREYESFHDVIITCVDRGDNAVPSTATLRLDVLDVNDNPPIFTRREYYVDVTENNDIDAVLSTVTATDADIGDNAIQVYSISPLLNYPNITDIFRINSTTGDLTTKLKFDHEQHRKYTIVVTATDSLPPYYNSSTIVLVTVLNINDEIPIFTGDFLLFLDEGKPFKSYIGTINATDPDAKMDRKSIEFNLVDHQEQFEIDMATGIMTSRVVFDREHREFYNVTVEIVDKTERTQRNRAVFTVKIVDINDNFPTFLFPRLNNNAVTLAEPVVRGDYITTLQANDIDSDENGRVEFSITDIDAMEWFIVDRFMGVVRSTQDIDIVNKTRMFVVPVRAQDRGLPNKHSDTILYVTFTKETMHPYNDDDNLIITAAVVSITLIVSTIIIGITCVIRKRGVPVVEHMKSDPHNTRTYDERDSSGRKQNYDKPGKRVRGSKLQFPLGHPDKEPTRIAERPGSTNGDASRIDNLLTVPPTPTDDSGSVITYDSGRGASELDNSGLDNSNNRSGMSNLDTSVFGNDEPLHNNNGWRSVRRNNSSPRNGANDLDSGVGLRSNNVRISHDIIRVNDIGSINRKQKRLRNIEDGVGQLDHSRLNTRNIVRRATSDRRMNEMDDDTLSQTHPNSRRSNSVRRMDEVDYDSYIYDRINNPREVSQLYNTTNNLKAEEVDNNNSQTSELRATESYSDSDNKVNYMREQCQNVQKTNEFINSIPRNIVIRNTEYDKDMKRQINRMDSHSSGRGSDVGRAYAVFLDTEETSKTPDFV